jgi:hypothetical protein
MTHDARPQSAVFTVKNYIWLWAGQNRAQKAGLLKAITFQGFGMARSKWVESLWTMLRTPGYWEFGRQHWLQGVGATFEITTLLSRPRHAPLSLTGAKDPLLWSGTDSDTHGCAVQVGSSAASR